MFIKVSDKYILSRFALLTIPSVFILCFIISAGFFFKNLNFLFLEQQANLPLILDFFLFTITSTAGITLSWSALFATLFFSREFSEKNEINAITSSGISLKRYYLPIFLVAILITILSWQLNHKYSLQARIKFSKNIAKNTANNPQLFLHPRISSQYFSKQKSYIHQIEGNKLKGIHLYLFKKEKDELKPQSYLYAEKGEVIPNEKELEFNFLKLYSEEISKNLPNILFASTASKWNFNWKKKEKIKLSSQPSKNLKQILEKENLPTKKRIYIHKKIAKRHSFSLIYLMALPLAIGQGIGAKNNRKKEKSPLLYFCYYLLIFSIFSSLGSKLSTSNIPLIYFIFLLPNVIFLLQGLYVMKKLKY